MGCYDKIDVLHASEAAANVLCQADVAKHYPMYEVEEGVRVLTDTTELDFAKRGKRFVLDVSTNSVVRKYGRAVVLRTQNVCNLYSQKFAHSVVLRYIGL
jgi:hypothetical protein